MSNAKNNYSKKCGNATKPGFQRFAINLNEQTSNFGQVTLQIAWLHVQAFKDALYQISDLDPKL